MSIHYATFPERPVKWQHSLQRRIKQHQPLPSISRGQLDLVVELRVKDGIALTDSISRIQGVGSVSLMKHDGEVTY